MIGARFAREVAGGELAHVFPCEGVELVSERPWNPWQVFFLEHCVEVDEMPSFSSVNARPCEEVADGVFVNKGDAGAVRAVGVVACSFFKSAS